MALSESTCHCFVSCICLAWHSWLRFSPPLALLLSGLRGVSLCPFFVLRPFLLLRVRSLPLLVFAPWAVVPFRARYAEFGLDPSASVGPHVPHSPFSGSKPWVWVCSFLQRFCCWLLGPEVPHPPFRARQPGVPSCRFLGLKCPTPPLRACIPGLSTFQICIALLLFFGD